MEIAKLLAGDGEAVREAVMGRESAEWYTVGASVDEESYGGRGRGFLSAESVLRPGGVSASIKSGGTL